MKTIEQILFLLKKAKALHQQSLNDDLSEDDGDHLYTEAWSLWEEAARHIVTMTNSRVDYNTALRIAIDRGDDVMVLLNKVCI